MLYIVVALVKLFVFHSCTIDVFLRYVRIKKFIIIIKIDRRKLWKIPIFYVLECENFRLIYLISLVFHNACFE